MAKINPRVVFSSTKRPFVPRTIEDAAAGLPRSVQHVLALIDTTDPAWPSVAVILREFLAAGIELDETSAVMAVKLGKQRWATECPADESGPFRGTLASGSNSIVYYIRRSEWIKIGTTTDPHERFRDLLPDEILAFEPGGYKEERLRHRQFGHLRWRTEYFRDATELRDHIAHLHALHGDPDPTWPTMARHSGASWRMPRASVAEAMTTAQAASELGIRENTIRVWAHRGRVAVAGIDERGRSLYYREHLIALRDSTERRLADCGI